MSIAAPTRSTSTRLIGENRTFRRLLTASSVSMLGSHVTTIAYPLLVLRLTGSPFIAGFAVFTATAPSIFAYIPAGALVDRWNPRRVMLMSELGRGLAIATVVIEMALGRPTVTLLMAVAIIEGVFEVFSGLAEPRFVGSLMPSDQVPSTTASIEARMHVTLVAGRPFGGLLFGIGPIFPFLADTLSFAYSIFAIIRIKDNTLDLPASETLRGFTGKTSLMTEIRQGLRCIRENKFARTAIVSFSVTTLIFQALIMVFLGEAQRHQLSAFYTGLTLAASGIGGFLGSRVAKRVLGRAGNLWLRYQALVWMVGIVFLILPVGQEYFVMAIIMAILGFTGSVGNIALNTHLRQEIKQELLGRVTSLDKLTSLTAAAIGPIIGGVLVQGLSAPYVTFFLFILALVPLWLAFSLNRSQPASSATGQGGGPGGGASRSNGPIDNEQGQLEVRPSDKGGLARGATAAGDRRRSADPRKAWVRGRGTGV